MEIGWNQLLCGRLAHNWGIIIANHLHLHKVNPKQMTALIWGRKFAGLMFQFILDVWKLRNEEAHLSWRHHESSLTRERLMAQIEALQSSNPDIEYSERDFIYKPLETLQGYSIRNLRGWYLMAMDIVKHSIRRRAMTGSGVSENQELG